MCRQTVSLSVDILLPDVNATVGAFVAARINEGGCPTSRSNGVFFWIDTSGAWTMSHDLGMWVGVDVSHDMCKIERH